MTTPRAKRFRPPKDNLSWTGGYRTSQVSEGRAIAEYEYSGKVWVRSYQFDQIHDLMDESINPVYHSTNQGLIDEINQKMRRGEQFYVGGFGTFKKVQELLTKGWPEGAERIERMAEKVEVTLPNPRGIRRRLKWADNGDEYDKDRMYDGHWDTPWRSTTRAVAVATPVIDILVPMDGNCDRTHDELFWSGAAALSLMHKLEAAGYQTSLTAALTTACKWNRSEGYFGNYFLLKRAGDPLQPDALAAVICSGAVFRCYGFNAIAKGPFELSSGLGRSEPPQPLVPIAAGEGVIDLPQVIMPQVFREGDARSAVLKALEDLAAANLAALPEAVVEGR
jgi:hypothetical protein